MNKMDKFRGAAGAVAQNQVFYFIKYRKIPSKQEGNK